MDTGIWLNELFRAIDSMSTKGFTEFLTEDVKFQFGNTPSIRGRAAVEAMVEGFFRSISALPHTVQTHWTIGNTVICRGTVRYRRLDGSEVSVPFANITERTSERVNDYQIFVDVSPLYPRG